MNYKKKKVIWGTGIKANVFASTLSETIEFFVEGSGSGVNVFMGKPVYRPNEVESWKDLFVYIPENYFREISLFLVNKGLKEGIDFSTYNSYNNKPYIDFDTSEKELFECKDELSRRKTEFYGKTLYVGELISSYGYDSFIKNYADAETGISVISEAFWIKSGDAEAELGVPVVTTPRFFNYNIWIKGTSTSEYECIPNVEAFEDVIEQAMLMFPSITINEAKHMISRYYEFYSWYLDSFNPGCIVAEHSFAMTRRILNTLCEEKKIPIVFTHPGVIPGTIAFDIGGEMGKSLVTIKHDLFLKLPISREEKVAAENVVETVFTNRMNRKKQPKDDTISQVINKCKIGRPTILYVGQYDVSTGLDPYTKETQQFYSPCFKSSLEAGLFLSSICIKNDWNMIYKPHPMYVIDEELNQLPSSTIVVKYGNILDLIDYADVVITIVSSSNYDSLFRNKPVVMLGYNQTRGKGCTYEAFDKESVEPTIEAALRDGYTNEQKEAFVTHVAQLLKYYLFDDTKTRGVRYGRCLPHCIGDFYYLSNLLMEKLGKED